MIDPADVTMADPLATIDIEALSARPVFDDLFDEIISGALLPPDEDDSAAARPRNRRGRRGYVVVAVAAMVIAVAVGVAVVNSGPSHPPGQKTTPWEAARPLPSAEVSPKGGAAHGWELVGDIVSTGWQLHTSGPKPGAVACPTTSICYVLANTATKPSGPAQFGAFYASADFGASWSVLPVPGGLTVATPISCPSALTCEFGALLDNRAVLVTTADGGHQWTTTPVADGGQFTALTCFSDGSCDGLMVANATGPASEGHPGPNTQPVIFVRTTDSGADWYRNQIQPLQVQANMYCSDSLSCVVHGLAFSLAKPYFRVEKTSDGGQSWMASELPEGFTPGYEISCPTTSNCIMAGQTGIFGAIPCVTNAAGDLTNLNVCTFGPTDRGVVGTTTDGGASWQLDPNFPTDASIVQTLTCASARICWVTGQTFSSGPNAVLWGTYDGGTTWSQVPLTIPPGAPEDIGKDSYDSIGRISCPTAGACLALGIVDQGAASTPVYSFRAPS
jgi:photosystem II stability/assembly factor-like uncharacterized protein